VGIFFIHLFSSKCLLHFDILMKLFFLFLAKFKSYLPKLNGLDLFPFLELFIINFGEIKMKILVSRQYTASSQSSLRLDLALYWWRRHAIITFNSSIIIMNLNLIVHESIISPFKYIFSLQSNYISTLKNFT
jgi:hypothetical protein